jgi:enoyl-CoA hydratase/carnithine racemase
MTGTKPLNYIVGLPRVLELCLTSRTVRAAGAASLRLAKLVVPAAELEAAVGDLVAALLAVEPAVARATKELLQQAPGRNLDEQSAAERRTQIALQRERLGWEAVPGLARRRSARSGERGVQGSFPRTSTSSP